MRSTDDAPHRKAIERRHTAFRNLIGSTLFGCAGLYLMVATEHVLYGIVSCCLAFGIAALSDVKELL